MSHRKVRFHDPRPAEGFDRIYRKPIEDAPEDNMLDGELEEELLQSLKRKKDDVIYTDGEVKITREDFSTIGACNGMSAEHLVHGDWTLVDVKKIATSDFFNTGQASTLFHMSDVYKGDLDEDPKNVKGWGCFESLGEYENMRFAHWLDDNCVKKLGISEDKCEALEGVVETYAKDTKIVAALKEIGRDTRLFIVFSAVTISGYLFLHKGGGGGGSGGSASRKALIAIGGALAAVGAISIALQLFARVPVPEGEAPRAIPYPTLEDALSAPSAGRVPLIEPWQMYSAAGIAATAATFGIAAFFEIPAAAIFAPAAAAAL